MYLDLTEIKTYIKAELDIDLEDTLLVRMASAAQAHFELRTGKHLEDIAAENGGLLPDDLMLWLLGYVATATANREHITYLTPHSNKLFDNIIHSYEL